MKRICRKYTLHLGEVLKDYSKQEFLGIRIDIEYCYNRRYNWNLCHPTHIKNDFRQSNLC